MSERGVPYQVVGLLGRLLEGLGKMGVRGVRGWCCVRLWGG